MAASSRANGPRAGSGGGAAGSPKVDAFLRREEKWRPEFEKLRKLILDCGLTEDLKWGQPCYSLDGKNVVLIHGFKEYCAMLFMKGVLLPDPKGILIQQTKNVQAARQIRFTSVQQIAKLEKTLTTYVREAIELEKSGAKVPLKRTEDFEMPAELEERLDKSANLRKAFAALTPGRQRGYIYYFSQAKQSKTRESRIDKCIPRILEGLGWDDDLP
ncbi:MAG: YdeI/OmpD-associated family protein [Polyangiaceae bacterium]|jgi:uncharacterized protein YdeI (YjbR/CyaY-like superfamily)